MIKSAAQCTNPSSFTLKIDNIRQDYHEEFIDNNQSIKYTLNLIKRRPDKVGLVQFGKDLKNLISLQHLHLDFKKYQIDIEFMKILSSSIKGLTNLTSFQLDNSQSNSSSESLSNLILSLNYLKNLTTLILNLNQCQNINSKFMSDLTMLLQNQKQLSKLDINLFSCYILTKEAIQLSNSLSKLKKLKSLNLIICDFGQQGLSSLFYSLQYCKKLEILSIDFSQNKNISDGVKKLGKSLASLQNLSDLSLIFPSGELENPEIEYLAKGIEVCNNLTKLNLELKGYNIIQILFDSITRLQLTDFTFDFTESDFKHKSIIKIFEIQNVKGDIYVFEGECGYISKRSSQNVFNLYIENYFDIFLQQDHDPMKFQNIQELYLEIAQNDDGDMESVFDFINMFENLKQLNCDLLNFDQYKNNFDWIESTFSECKNLQYVTLCLNKNLDYSINNIQQRFYNQLIKSQKHLVYLQVNI